MPTGANVRIEWADYEGEFSLSSNEVNALVIHHDHLTQQVFGWLDAEYRLMPGRDAHWPMLGQHAVELLHISDPRAFSGVCTRMVQTMLRDAPNSPFTVASMAESRLTSNEIYETLLSRLLESAQESPFGLIPFATGFLNLGDQFSTLWALRILILSGRVAEFDSVVQRGVQALGQSFGVLAKHADHVGFLLYVLSLLGRDEYRALAVRCLDHLTKADVSWQRDLSDLRRGGFVAYDLLAATAIRPEAMRFAEDWLRRAFDLSDEAPTGLPPAFSATADNESGLPLDSWVQGWLRALVAAALYLRIRRPEYSFASHLLAQSVAVANDRKTLQAHRQVLSPWLPGVAKLFSLHAQLQPFWEVGPYEKSVFIMRWMGSNGPVDTTETPEVVDAIREIVSEELDKAGLIGRYVGDRPNYAPELFANNELYMRGCKHGIAIYERLPRNTVTPLGPNHNVLVETGFMRGKGARTLLLYDKTMETDTEKEVPEGTGLPAVLNGAIREPFDCSTTGGKMLLRQAVRRWAEDVVREEAAS